MAASVEEQEFVAPLFGLEGTVAQQSYLSGKLARLLATTDLHTACLDSLASILAESQKVLSLPHTGTAPRLPLCCTSHPTAPPHHRPCAPLLACCHA